MRQNAYDRNLKWTFEDLLPCDCYAIQTNDPTIRSQALQPASAGEVADMNKLHVTRIANLALVQCVILANKLPLQELK